MKIECRNGSVCVIAESHDDNSKLRRIGADHDRATVSVSVTRDPETVSVTRDPETREMQLAGGPPFEPLVIVLSKAEDDPNDLVCDTA